MKKNLLSIALSLAIATPVVASEIAIPNSFSAGDTISAGQMNDNFTTVQGGVNDNNTRINDNAAAIDTNATNITNNANDIATINSALSGIGTCAGNNASDLMVQVGSLCVDLHKATLWTDSTDAASAVGAIPADCNTLGKSEAGDGVGCGGIVAQSREVPNGALGTNISWMQAQQACANAGKRLITAGEYLMLFASPLVTDIEVADQMEFVDAIFTQNDQGIVNGGYIGARSQGTGAVQMFDNLGIDGSAAFIGFRCAR